MVNKKWFLYITEFFSGMSVMAIELGASRLLAPYFSSSQIVWTVIIGAIMIAMALGNLWGGRMADRDASPDRLYGRLLIVAVYVAAIPFVGKYVIAAVSLALAAFSAKGFLIWASLISCLLLFVYPLMLLGTVTPSLVKYTVNRLDESGKTVGELNALNTVGSIIGTFTPTFITIPAVGTAWTFLIFASILLIISLIYFLSVRKRLIRALAATLLAILFAVLSSFSTFALSTDGNVYEDESIYNYLQVTETDSYVALSTNVMFGVQSFTRKDGRLTGMYYDYALAAPRMAVGQKQDPNVLILGFGSGTYALSCRKYFPSAKVEGVEIDRKIIDLAYDRFFLPENDANIKVVEFDGRAYLRTAGKYDAVMVDAYRDITIPFSLSTVEFFKEVKEHLTPNGVVVINMNMRSQKENSINQYLCDTVASVFHHVYYADCEGNREVFAFSDPACRERLKNSAEGEDADFCDMMETVNERLHKYVPENRLLTDDKAPVELLGVRAIDELIEAEIGKYKKSFKGKSFSEILDSLQ